MRTRKKYVNNGIILALKSVILFNSVYVVR